jgi:hypothetical protein
VIRIGGYVVTLLKATKSRRCDVCDSEISIGGYYVSAYSREYRGGFIIMRYCHYCLNCVTEYIDLLLLHKVKRLFIEVENGEVRTIIPDIRYKLGDTLRRLLQKYAHGNR